ncbi:hypothetical protein [Nonomuraea lactucae]|uniref:hypothetical protein n=1 Tax=Nonomuraea lactucae TaxID=2249762 RepID=UPI0013B37E86|nr:hypothetical protein [Nonomuraea lactucae]
MAETGVEDLLEARKKEKYYVTIKTAEPMIVVELYLGGAQVSTRDKKVAAKKLVDNVWLFTRAFKVPLVVHPLFVAIVTTSILFYALYGWYIIRYPDDFQAARLILYFTMIAIVNIMLIVRQYTHGSAYVIRRWRKDKMTQWRGIRKDVAMVAASGIVGGTITAAISALVVILNLPK